MQKKALGVLFITLLIDMIGVGMIIPIVPVLFTDPSSPSFLLMGYSQSAQYFLAGAITAIFALMQFLAAPILGELSDAFGRKRLLMLGVGVLALSQLLFGFGIEMKLLWLLFVSRAIAGLAAANFSIAQATIADVTEPKDRAKNFGLLGAAFGIGFIIGPVLGGWVAGTTGDVAAPFWAASALGILNILFVAFFLPETRKKQETLRTFHVLKGIHNIQAAFRDRDARPVYLASFLHVAGFSFYISFIGVFLVDRFGLSEASLGTFFGVVGGWIVVTQLFILRLLTKKYSERSILRVSMLLVAFSVGVYPFLGSLVLLYAMVPLLAIPNGLTMANMMALISKSVSADKQGAALGINGSLLAFAQGVVPMVAGLSSGLLGLSALFWVGALLICLGWASLFVSRSGAGKRCAS
jgi:DHA1 family tetracycline resistance protein-like MFS transporter